MRRGFYVRLLLACFSIKCVSSLQCLNEDGEVVDWWLAYSYGGDENAGLTGREYAYMDNTMSQFVIPAVRTLGNSKFALYPLYELALLEGMPHVPGGNNLNKSSTPRSPEASLLMHTMQQIYSDKGQKIAYVFYNDQEDSQGPRGLIPQVVDTVVNFVQQCWHHMLDGWGERAKKCGGLPHSKGVAAYDESGGFWLIHNLPKSFKDDPTTHDRPSLTSNFHHNAQAFFCMSLTLESMEKVARMLYMTRIKVLQRSEPGLLGDSVAGFEALVGPDDGNRGVIAKGKPADQEVDPVAEDLTTQGGTLIKAFAKPPFGSNTTGERLLWQDIVATTLESDLRVQTWRPDSDRGILPPYCGGKYDVYNVDGVTLKDDVHWVHEHDHAKWAVTTGPGGEADVPEDKKYICVGDINRDNSQRCKGGMAACIVNPEAWSAFTQWSDGQIDTCKSQAPASPSLATS